MSREDFLNGKISVTDADGNHFHYDRGQIHQDERDSNGRTRPAVIRANGDREWRRYGLFHNNDRNKNRMLFPAIVKGNGECLYYLHGMKIYKNHPKFQLLTPREESAQIVHRQLAMIISKL